MADSEFLSTRQAALRLGVSLGTVQNMVESGVLEAWKTSGGHRRIPVAAVTAMLAKRPLPLTASKEHPPLDILVTEDDRTMQALYESTIARWKLPVEVRLAANGFEGLLQVGRRTPDILIADLLMPGMDGFEMIRQLRANEELSGMDIIVVTAIEAEQLAEHPLPADVTVLGKPVPFNELKGFVLGRLAARLRAS